MVDKTAEEQITEFRDAMNELRDAIIEVFAPYMRAMLDELEKLRKAADLILDRYRKEVIAVGPKPKPSPQPSNPRPPSSDNKGWYPGTSNK